MLDERDRQALMALHRPGSPWQDDGFVRHLQGGTEAPWWEDLITPREAITRFRGDPDAWKPSPWQQLELGELSCRQLTTLVWNNFYLKRGDLPCQDGLSVPQGVIWVGIKDVPGGGKHSIAAHIERRIVEVYGDQVVFTEGLALELAVNKIKEELRRQGYVIPPLDHGTLGLNTLAEIELIRALAGMEHQYAITWRGTLSIFEDLLIHFHQGKLTEMIAKTKGFGDDLLRVDSLDEIVDKYREELLESWVKIAKLVGQPNQRVLFWPLFELPWPMIAFSNISVNRAWELQDVQGKLRGDARPGGPHPFSMEQLIQMRLLDAVMLRMFPEACFTFGSFRADFNEGGADEMALELLIKAAGCYGRFGGLHIVYNQSTACPPTDSHGE